MSVTKVEPL